MLDQYIYAIAAIIVTNLIWLCITVWKDNKNVAEMIFDKETNEIYMQLYDEKDIEKIKNTPNGGWVTLKFRRV